MPRPKPSPKTLALVAAWGAATVVIAYLISGGSPVWFLVALIGIAIAQRMAARMIVARRGQRPPRGWWM